MREPDEARRNKDAYHAPRPIDGLIVSESTGTNANDICTGLPDTN